MQPRVKCLLVDDLEENLLVLSTLLRRDDVELIQARSGREALELLLVHDVALAFLDVQMPEMDGFELAELMRGSERTRNVPIIFVTAGSHDSFRQFKGYEAGAVDFLYKPVDVRILKNKADVFFQLHRQKLQLAQELRERSETLRLNEMFTAVLGHDLRNPLGAILMAAQLLAHQTEDEGVRKTAERMRTSGMRMSRMIDAMLDLARARLAGGIPVTPAAADFGNVIERVLREHEVSFPGRQVEYRHEGDLHGQWDADRLAQMASNLISNALQYGNKDSPIEVQLDGTQRDTILLSVANAGTIPDEVLPRIFDPFRGGERLPGQNEGLGLGLYIVQQIVHAHRGSIAVDSDNGRTTFRVTIPRAA
ncbi:MAG: hybrid sensor histidine kinase/response regulator [Betaproteobacteria bacterium]